VLLQDGFGLHLTNHPITFSYSKNGIDVEWPLGFFLNLEEEKQQNKDEKEEKGEIIGDNKEL